MSSNAESSDDQERAVLTRALIRVAALTDEELPAALDRLLPKVLPLMRRQSLRTHALQLVQTIAKRIYAYSPQPIPLNLPLLVTCVTDPMAISQLDANFALLFIDTHVQALQDENKSASLWIQVGAPLINGIAARNQDNITVILHIFIALLPSFIIARRDLAHASEKEQLKHDLGMNLSSADDKILLKFLLDLLLYPYSNSNVVRDQEAKETDKDVFPTYPGLSPSDVSIITRNGRKTWSHQNLAKVKSDILCFLKSGIFDSQDIYSHLLVALVDSNDGLVASAEDAIRRLGRPNLDDHPDLLKSLFGIYLGNKDLQRKSCSEKLKIRILRELQRSVLSAKLSSSAFKVLLDSIVDVSTSLKLQISGIQFLQWVLKHGIVDDFKKIAPVLLKQLLKILKECCEDNKQTKLRALMYEPLAELSILVPEIVNRSVQIPIYFFKRIGSENASIISNVEIATKNLAQAFSESTSHVTDQLKAFLLQILNDELFDGVEISLKQRVCALHWLNTIFPFHDGDIRLLCCKLSSEDQTDLKEGGRKGLLPRLKKGQRGETMLEPFPEFQSIVSLFQSQLQSLFTANIKVSPTYYMEVLDFIKKCLKFSLSQVKIEPHNLKESIFIYLHFISQVFIMDIFEKVSLTHLHVRSAELLNEISNLAPELVFERIDLSFISPFLEHKNPSLRNSFGQVLGKISAYFASDTFSCTVENCIQLLNSSEVKGHEVNISGIHGHILALKSMIENNSKERFDKNQRNQITMILVYFLGSSSSAVSRAACECLGRVFIDFNPEWTEDAVAKKNYSSSQAIARILKLTRVSESDLCISAFNSLSLFCQSIATSTISLGSSQCLDLIYGTLLQFTNIRDPEVSLACGNVIADLSCIPKADESSKHYLLMFLNAILESELPNASKIARLNLCLWILCIVYKCSSHISAQENLPNRIQQALCSLLKEEKQVTQEAASKGLMFLYDRSNPDMKLSLSKSFLFLPGKIASSLSSQSQSTAEGKDNEKTDVMQRVSIYGELTFIAEDLNQPGLLYYFLDLACSDPLWFGVQGSKFSLDGIQRITQTLLPRVDHLLPKLYRNQYHSVPFVKKVMNSLWKILVPDPEKMISLNSVIILEYLCYSVESPHVRTRETGCLALVDFLKNESSSLIVNFFNRLWKLCFFLLDDMETSIRLSALQLGKALIAITENLLQSNEGPEETNRIINELLTLILDRGVSHAAKEVQQVSMLCIVSLTGAKSPALVPHLPQIVGMLLDAFTLTESAELSYAMNHAEALKTTPEQIESLKLMLANNSPLAKALMNCTDIIDPSIVPALISSIGDSVRFSSGISTLDQAGKFVKTLTDKYPVLVSTFSKHLLQVFQNHAFSQQQNFRKIASSTMGVLLSVSNHEAVLSFCKELQRQYLNVHLKNAEVISGEVAHEIVKLAKNPQDDFLSYITSLSYIASCDSREDCSRIWSIVWNEISGKQSDLDQRLEDVLDTGFYFLRDGSYLIRETASCAIFRIYRYSKNDAVLESYSRKAVKRLIESLGRKDREGKARIYEAVVEIFRRVTTFPKEDALIHGVMNAFLQEASSPVNQAEVLGAIASLLNRFPSFSPDVFPAVFILSEKLISGSLVQLEKTGNYLKDEDDFESVQSKVSKTVKALEILELLWESTQNKTDMQSTHFDKVLSILLRAGIGYHYMVRTQAFKSAFSFLGALPHDSMLLNDDVINSLLSWAFESMRDARNGSVRAAALTLIEQLFVSQRRSIVCHLPLILDKLDTLSKDDTPSVAIALRRLRERIS